MGILFCANFHGLQRKKVFFECGIKNFESESLILFFSIVWHYKISLCHIWFINFTVFLCSSPMISHPIICIFFIVFLSYHIVFLKNDHQESKSKFESEYDS